MDIDAIHSTGKLTLQVVGDDTSSQGDPDFYLDVPGSEGYVVGRSDRATNYLPDIDLADFGAREKGISRRHAVFVNHRGYVHVIDLGSMNGTYVNGKRLPANVAFGLSKGDSISFASLHLIVSHVS